MFFHELTKNCHLDYECAMRLYQVSALPQCIPLIQDHLSVPRGALAPPAIVGRVRSSGLPRISSQEDAAHVRTRQATVCVSAWAIRKEMTMRARCRVGSARNGGEFVRWEFVRLTILRAWKYTSCVRETGRLHNIFGLWHSDCA